MPALQAHTPPTHELPEAHVLTAVHGAPGAVGAAAGGVTDAAQLPWSQTSAPLHAVWQLPQCAPSEPVSTHTPPQAM